MAKDDPFGSEQPSTDPFGRPISASDDSFSSPGPTEPASAPPPPDAWPTGPAPPPTGDYGVPATPGQRADGAIPALILGIVGLIFCPLAAPFAWALGRSAERRVDASGGALGGRGEATTGKILGIVVTILWIIGIVLFIGLIAVGVSTVEDGGGTTTTFEF